jgi:hypothetical protein
MKQKEEEEEEDLNDANYDEVFLSFSASYSFEIFRKKCNVCSFDHIC